MAKAAALFAAFWGDPENRKMTVPEKLLFLFLISYNAQSGGNVSATSSTGPNPSAAQSIPPPSYAVKSLAMTQSRLFRLMFGLAAAGLAAAGFAAEPTPAPKKGKDPNERICETQGVVGSRLATRRVCATRAEWAERRPGETSRL